MSVPPWDRRRWGFVRAASALDGFVDDLHRAELPAVQAAWYTAVKRDSRAKLAIARSALCRWLEEVLSKPLEPPDAQRLARILGWLRDTPLPRHGDVSTALSSDAFAQLLRICADAIAAGRGRDWPLDASQLSRSERWAFNRWSIALMREKATAIAKPEIIEEVKRRLLTARQEVEGG